MQNQIDFAQVLIKQSLENQNGNETREKIFEI
jgi:hypothetical protein